jgi:membrane protein YdbS with pleckstrin-like domain
MDCRGWRLPAQLGDTSLSASLLVAQPDSGLQPVDRRAVKAWRLEAVLDSAIALVLGGGASFALWRFGLHPGLAVLPVAAALIFAIANIGIRPERRWRSWRYAIGDVEIELRHGIWWQTWTRIPMARIQHVDTRRGPLDRRYGLANLVLYTAAGARQIPGLSIEVAEQSRDRIAALANVRDDV